MSQGQRMGSRPGVARKISSDSAFGPKGKTPSGPLPPGGRQRAAWTLRSLGGLFFIPAFIRLAAGDLLATVGSLAVAGLLIAAAEVIKRGIRNELAYNRRGVAKAPPPLKAVGAGMVGLAAFLASFLMSDDGIGIALLFGVLGGAASIYAYGLDPTRNKLLDGDGEHGVSSERVIETVRLAEGKLADIKAAAQTLRSRPVRERVSRIVAQADRVLHQVEQDPGDIARARRFFVTYLDGLRDVVTKYAKQQQDLADTELADNLSRVLVTIEQVFIEQEEVLKRDEALDLEVKIEVLETQLKREGVN